MKHARLVPTFLLLLANVSCNTSANAPVGKQDVPPTRPVSPLAATRPASAEPAPVRRLTSLRSILLGLQQEYLAEEGPARRGKRFAALVSGLDEVRRKEPPMTEIEVLAWLGPPDYGDSDERGAEYYYLYEHAAPKDWYASPRFDPNGSLSRVGWNATSMLPLAGLHPYRVLHLAEVAAKTRAKLGAGYLGVRTKGLFWPKDGHTYIGSYGVEVTAVDPESPASRAGIQSGDRITRINGARFETDEFIERVSQLPPGQVASFTILRDLGGPAMTEEKPIDVTVGSRPQVR
jgi:hypothetical protein